MTLHACELLTGARRKRAQRYALVYLDMIADRGGFANDNARGMVDEEVFTDRSARIDVYARTAMRIFGHDAWNQRHLLHVKLMGDAVHEYRKESRIRKDDLLFALCGRVAVESSLHILEKGLVQFGQLRKERFRYLVHARFDLFLRHGVAVAEQQSLAQLALQGVFDTNERIADEIAGVAARGDFLSEITGEHQVAQIRQNADDCIPVGKMAVGLGEKDFGRFVILRDTFDDVVACVRRRDCDA